MVDVTIIGGLLIAYIAVEAVIAGIEWCLRLLSKRKLEEKCKEWLVNVPLSEADMEIIENNRKLLRSKIPEGGLGENIKMMSREDRIRFLIDLLEEASNNYGVEISSVKFAPSSEIGSSCYGFYAFDENMVVLNLDMVCSDSVICLEEIVDTVFHELRHAQQYRAVTDDSYNFGTEEQRLRWGLNFMPNHYIRGEVDFELYQRQTVEADARLVAHETIKGF
jgi:hypothetical protein